MSTKQRYLVLFEGSERTNFSASAPDVPGCVATGATEQECRRTMEGALAFHFEALRDSGEPIPEPSVIGAAFLEPADR